jgi:hypothetical protein
MKNAKHLKASCGKHDFTIALPFRLKLATMGFSQAKILLLLLKAVDYIG